MEHLSALSDSTLDREVATLVGRAWHTVDEVEEIEDIHGDLFAAFSLRLADDECAGAEAITGGERA
jgi:hypothetical protein